MCVCCCRGLQEADGCYEGLFHCTIGEKCCTNEPVGVTESGRIVFGCNSVELEHLLSSFSAAASNLEPVFMSVQEISVPADVRSSVVHPCVLLLLVLMNTVSQECLKEITSNLAQTST